MVQIPAFIGKYSQNQIESLQILDSTPCSLGDPFYSTFVNIGVWESIEHFDRAIGKYIPEAVMVQTDDGRQTYSLHKNLLASKDIHKPKVARRITFGRASRVRVSIELPSRKNCKGERWCQAVSAGGMATISFKLGKIESSVDSAVFRQCRHEAVRSPRRVFYDLAIIRRWTDACTN
jgi:hypothetical protein